jgi:hypothetical protein
MNSVQSKVWAQILNTKTVAGAANGNALRQFVTTTSNGSFTGLPEALRPLVGAAIQELAAKGRRAEIREALGLAR